jgi:hypothetical protein
MGHTDMAYTDKTGFFDATLPLIKTGAVILITKQTAIIEAKRNNFRKIHRERHHNIFHLFFPPPVTRLLSLPKFYLYNN